MELRELSKRRETDLIAARKTFAMSRPPGSAHLVDLSWQIESPHFLIEFAVSDPDKHTKAYFEQNEQVMTAEGWSWLVDFVIDCAATDLQNPSAVDHYRLRLFTALWLCGGLEAILSNDPLPNLFNGFARSAALFPPNIVENPPQPYVYAMTNKKDVPLPGEPELFGASIAYNAPPLAGTEITKFSYEHPVVCLIIIICAILGVSFLVWIGWAPDPSMAPARSATSLYAIPMKGN